jgi:thiamine biosynthesis lipoprotein ApbE
MSEREFIVWLGGFVEGVGDTPTNRHWEILINKLHTVDIIDLDNGKSKKILHDGTLNIIRDTKK